MARRVSSPVLVGRERERLAFQVALDDCLANQPALLVLGGEAGIGKSRLLATFAGDVRDAGGLAAIGAAPPITEEGPLPFAPLTQVLRTLVRSIDAREIATLPESSRSALAALLPELGPQSDLRDDRDRLGQARLVDAVMGTVERAASAARPVLLGFDDFQWADASTRMVVGHLFRNLSEGPVLGVVTYRSDAATTSLLELLAELDRTAGVERLEVGALSQPEVEQQVAAILGDEASAPVVRAIVERSDGNPFFVEELAAHASRGPDRAFEPPPSVRAMVAVRLARLAPEAREVASLTAVAGEPVPSALPGLALRLPDDAARRATRDAVAANLLEVLEAGGDDSLAVRHVLVRDAIVATLAAADRRRLHASIASALRSRPELAGRSEVERTARLSGHLVGSGDRVAALEGLRMAADAAERARAFTEADAMWTKAVEVADTLQDQADRSERMDLLEHAAEGAYLAGRPRRAAELADQLAGLAGTTDATGPTVAERPLRPLLRRGRYLVAAGRTNEAIAMFEEAASTPAGDETSSLRALLELARAQLRAGRYRDAGGTIARAAPLAEAVGSVRDRAAVASVQGVCLAVAGHHAQAMEQLTAARRLDASARPDTASRLRPSRLPDQLQAAVDQVTVLEQSGDFEGAAQEAASAARHARDLGLGGIWAAALDATAARNLLHRGAWDEADRLTADSAAAPDAPLEAILVQLLLAIRRGDREAADRLLTRIADRDAEASASLLGPEIALAGGELALERRQLDEARAQANRAMLRADETGDQLRLATATAFAIEVQVEAADLARARRAGPELASLEDAASPLWAQLTSIAIQDESPRQRALVAGATADLERLRGQPSPAAWQAAVTAWREDGDLFEVARSQVRLAEAMLDAGTARSDAAAPLMAALEVAEELGAAPLAKEIEQLARRARLDVRAREPSTAGHGPLVGPELEARRLGLSTREIEVLVLLAEGLTDREIGRELFITEKTAGHHVSHILTKLAVTRRGEAAAVAYRLGLTRSG
jgi:DNA-binding CsgD family transcriptional regulator/tetratricopeptide (TPR) repeat protein